MYSGLNPISKQRKYFGGGEGGERGKRYGEDEREIENKINILKNYSNSK